MSLINDALKKVSKEKGDKDSPSLGREGFDIPPFPRKKRPNPKGSLFLTFLGIFLFIGVAILVRLSVKPKTTHPSQKKAPKVSKEERKAHRVPIVLNGIVHGNGEEMAMLNNQIIRVGDEIEGATLSEVGADYVVLQKKGKPLKLKLR